ncbi:hypothetical protein [Gracilibacillus halophilus]|nr:hypothetical protein [Gracilibacillus halophilus]
MRQTVDLGEAVCIENGFTRQTIDLGEAVCIENGFTRQTIDLGEAVCIENGFMRQTIDLGEAVCIENEKVYDLPENFAKRTRRFPSNSHFTGKSRPRRQRISQ